MITKYDFYAYYPTNCWNQINAGNVQISEHLVTFRKYKTNYQHRNILHWYILLLMNLIQYSMVHCIEELDCHNIYIVSENHCHKSQSNLNSHPMIPTFHLKQNFFEKNNFYYCFINVPNDKFSKQKVNRILIKNQGCSKWLSSF